MAAAGSVGDGGVRSMAPPPISIVPATDLGSVITLKQGELYLLTDQFGDVHPDTRGLGLYRHDTRILSCAALRLNGARPALLRAAIGGTFEGSIDMTNPDNPRDIGDKIGPGALARRSIGVRRSRVIDQALEERLLLVNHAETPVTVAFELDLGADYADIFEVRGYQRPERGRLEAILLDRSGRAVRFGYRGLDGRVRRTHVRFSEPVRLEPLGAAEGAAGAEPPTPGGMVRASWRWRLGPGEASSLSWTVWGGVDDGADGRPGSSMFADPSPIRREDLEAEEAAWAERVRRIAPGSQLLERTIARSMADLRLLLTPGPAADERFISAGVPWFVALFGRDAVIASLQTIAFLPELAVGTLQVLAARQATEIDDWRDAEPGKMLHELRRGEVAAAGELPFTPYYGSVDVTPLWLILLGASYDWTGDRALIDRLWPNALAALEWIDRWGDRDGDGFVEYERRSPRGLHNQGWKDSGDSIRDRHGRQATGPIALAEVQGYVHAAKLAMAELAAVRGDPGLSARLRADAEALRERFEASFWVDDQQYYAMALDGDKRQVDGIGSNAGHCLWSGIVAPERAAAVVQRLLGAALFSGWGVRTYAAGQAGYNPIGYHTGSVWPHDTSIVAAGLKRYGFHDEANRLIGPMLEAASHFPDCRLPELFCGFTREGSEVPVPYPVACSPQAWAAGSPFLFLQTMLGLRAHADRHELELVAPTLPDWLSSIRLTVRVGEPEADLLFHRWRGTTSAEVPRRTGRLDVTIRL
ncbi:MAG TPA: glycogen debranching N-terminal domain-containing protein [Candidatus Dormibacteraeota bacterium]|nr:glycogen debranching N-terminal domain-containing protein [Candidatus Dormibacteraeota bacterium]